MSNYQKYQITLTPVDKFFFGGDMMFQVGAKDLPNNWDEITDENERARIEKQVEGNTRYSSYIIQSSLFPQQTSLLGMLRFLILRNEEDVFKEGQIVNKDRAKALIGERSFTVNANDHDENHFGLIKSLGHVRICRNAGKDEVTYLEHAPLFGELDFAKTSSGTYNMKDVCIPGLTEKEYKAKDGLSAKLTDGNSFYDFAQGEDPQKEGVFIEDRRIGIDRNIKTGKVEDAALFKQISYRFNNKKASYCFVFDAEVDDSLNLETYSGQLVSIGGDNSQFVIGISKAVDSKCGITSMNNAVCLLSPTFLTRAEAQTAKFAITRLMPFRFLLSEMDKVKSYHILSGNLTRSERYELYAPGSVFYFENEKQKDAFAGLIEAKKEFRQIGYNEYK